MRTPRGTAVTVVDTQRQLLPSWAQLDFSVASVNVNQMSRHQHNRGEMHNSTLHNDNCVRTFPHCRFTAQLSFQRSTRFGVAQHKNAGTQMTANQTVPLRFLPCCLWREINELTLKQKSQCELVDFSSQIAGEEPKWNGHIFNRPVINKICTFSFAFK